MHAVVAHGFSDAAPFPLPAPLLLFAAGLVVAAAGAVAPQHAEPPPALARSLGPNATAALRIVAGLLLVAIVVPAAFGAADIGQNPAPRLLFTVAWGGLLVASMLVGPLWARANPIRWIAGGSARGADFYARVGVWPAVAALLLFSLAEQVADPTPLLVLLVVGLYVVAAGAGAVVYGRAWFRAADPLEVASRFLGRLAPVGRRGRRLVARRMRAGVAATGTAPGMAAFLGVLVGSSLFDALEPSGGLWLKVVLFLLVVGITAGALAAAARPEYLTPALIPAAAAPRAAHNLVPLLVDTHIAAVQASDPLNLGWDLFGLTGAEPNATPIPIIVAQLVQLLLLVGGHALSMVAASDIAARHMSPQAAKAALFPLRAAVIAMVAAGVFVWLVA